MVNNSRYLFKGKIIDGFGERSGRWVTGDLSETWDFKYLIGFRLEDHPYAEVIKRDGAVKSHIEIDPTTVCQCTGETDMENKDLFEGDIVEMDSWHPKEMLVGFIEGAFCLCHLEKFKNTGKLEYVADIHYIQHAGRKQAKIIGNIHES